jgi:hypothetical protein
MGLLSFLRSGVDEKVRDGVAARGNLGASMGHFPSSLRLPIPASFEYVR